MNREDVYLQAMRGADGTINVGYLVLFRSGRAVIIICALIVAAGFVEMWHSPTHAYPIAAVTDGIAKLIAAFGVLLAALGAYLWGDSKQMPTATYKQTTETTEPAPAPPPPHPVS